MTVLHRPVRRLSQLLLGLFLYGWSMAMMIRADLGLDPWDVFHYGLAGHVPLTFGQVTIVVGAAVLLLWVPLRQKPGIGTVLNIVVIGLSADLGLSVMAEPSSLVPRAGLLVGGVVLNGLAGALYVGAHLGPGPRDGLWVAVTRRWGWSIRWVRTVIELTVLVVGWALGGVVGVGTVLYAVSIGHLNQFFLPRVEVAPPAASGDGVGGCEGPDGDPREQESDGGNRFVCGRADRVVWRVAAVTSREGDAGL